MKNRKRPPAHPGALIKRQYIEASGISITSLADSLKISRKTMSKIVNERSGITTDMALRFSAAFNTTPELWLNLQNNYDLWHAINSKGSWKTIKKLELEPVV